MCVCVPVSQILHLWRFKWDPGSRQRPTSNQDGAKEQMREKTDILSLQSCFLTYTHTCVRYVSHTDPCCSRQKPVMLICLLTKRVKTWKRDLHKVDFKHALTHAHTRTRTLRQSSGLLKIITLQTMRNTHRVSGIKRQEHIWCLCKSNFCSNDISQTS